MISVNCNYCGRDDFRIIHTASLHNSLHPDVDAYRCTCASYGSHPQIVRCRHCGHVYANPRWGAPELIDAYSAVEDEVYIAERAAREQTFRHHLADLEAYTGPAEGRSLLDVGAYVGVFVEVALTAGWQAMGIEPSRWAAGVAQAAGLPIVEGTLRAEALAGRRFDVITLWDVIEHLADPLADLHTAYELLKPGGLIVVHTMDIDSLTARLMGRRWPWIMDMHIHYFSQRTLGLFLAKAGFEPLWIGPHGRYLSLGYLVTRIAGMSRPLGRLADSLVGWANLEHKTVPVNFGDLITAYARHPVDPPAENTSASLPVPADLINKS